MLIVLARFIGAVCGGSNFCHILSCETFLVIFLLSWNDDLLRERANLVFCSGNVRHGCCRLPPLGSGSSVCLCFVREMVLLVVIGEHTRSLTVFEASWDSHLTLRE